MISVKQDARMFEPLKCSNCESTEELQRHRYSEEVKCLTCINVLLSEQALEDEKEGYYTDYSYEYLAQERNR